MNQSKFSLADVLTVLSALSFGFVCFLSANFYTLGNTKQSILLSVIITVLMGVTALGAKFLKRTSRNFKTSFKWEMILLVLFTGLTFFFAYSPFPHYFVVSGQKTVIQGKLIATITQAENMFSEYERYAENRETLYKNILRSVVTAKSINSREYAKYGFVNNTIADDKQIENKMFTVHADLFPSNFKEMKTADSTWLTDARSIVEKWKRISIVRIVNEVELNSNDWLDKLVKLSAIRENGEQASDFDYKLSFDDVKKHFTTLGKPTPLSIGLAILAYMLMLFSYLISKRSTKTTVGTIKGKGDFDIEY